MGLCRVTTEHWAEDVDGEPERCEICGLLLRCGYCRDCDAPEYDDRVERDSE